MSFYRSQSVRRYRLILPRDNAHQIMNDIGQQNLIHIEPLGLPFLNRPFVHQVKRCSDCLLRIQEIETLLNEKSLLVRRKEFTITQYHDFFEEWAKLGQGSMHSINVLDHIDREVQQIWALYRQSTKRFEEIKEKVEFSRSNLAIIKAGFTQFGASFFAGNDLRLEQIGIEMREMSQSQINIKAGIIRMKDELQLKRTAFRISRNNCFFVSVPFSSVFDKLSQDEEDKVVFFLLFSGLKGGVLERKLDRFISVFSGQRYNIPSNPTEFNRMKQSLEAEVTQNQNLLRLNEHELQEYLGSVSELLPNRTFTKFEAYKLYFMKEKQIYSQLNEMQVYNNFLQGTIYVCQKNIVQLQKCLKEIERKLNYPSGQLVECAERNPPTLHPVNLFTQSAQQIIETYGVPSYKEANPAFFTAITFPFLFGVMFGDIAHGSLIFLLGLYLTFSSVSQTLPFVNTLRPHRYMILLMGFFSIYCGFIYNDFMSVSLNLFGTCYNVAEAPPGSPVQRKSTECVYPVGIDPVWGVAENSLNFIDSLKMKISVIIAVVHMSLGVFIKGGNSLYFGRKLDFSFEFIPQLLFLLVLFGYMDFLIVFKWLKPWQPYDQNAPSIITTMINMPLKLGGIENCCGGQPLWGTPSQTSQSTIQLLLLIVAAICVPVMLLPKPIIQLCRKQEVKQPDQEELMEEKQMLHQIPMDQKHEPKSEIFVNQLIQTIEYVLGSISNTASYLRLWALSLAHSQLSEVFFQKTVQAGIASGFSGIPKMIFGFPVLAGATFGVLLCMDSMECFLHTLRLHWVEFQNKFYKGNGHPFIVFNFQAKISSELQN